MAHNTMDELADQLAKAVLQTDEAVAANKTMDDLARRFAFTHLDPNTQDTGARFTHRIAFHLVAAIDESEAQANALVNIMLTAQGDELLAGDAQLKKIQYHMRKVIDLRSQTEQGFEPPLPPIHFPYFPYWTVTVGECPHKKLMDKAHPDGSAMAEKIVYAQRYAELWKEMTATSGDVLGAILRDDEAFNRWVRDQACRITAQDKLPVELNTIRSSHEAPRSKSEAPVLQEIHVAHTRYRSMDSTGRDILAILQAPKRKHDDEGKEELERQTSPREPRATKKPRLLEQARSTASRSSISTPGFCFAHPFVHTGL